MQNNVDEIDQAFILAHRVELERRYQNLLTELGKLDGVATSRKAFELAQADMMALLNVMVPQPKTLCDSCQGALS